MVEIQRAHRMDGTGEYYFRLLSLLWVAPISHRHLQ